MFIVYTKEMLQINLLSMAQSYTMGQNSTVRTRYLGTSLHSFDHVKWFTMAIEPCHVEK